MIDLTVTGAVAAFNYVDEKMDNALSSYAKHRFETAADYITNGAWRKLFQKASEKLKGKNIDDDPNLEFIDQILNKTELLTDNNLLDLWASLLANAMQGKNSVRKEYFDVISKLNPYDVLVLNVAFEKERYDTLKSIYFSGKGGKRFIDNKLAMEFLSGYFNLDNEVEILLSIKNLINLGLFDENSALTEFSLSILGEGLKGAIKI